MRGFRTLGIAVAFTCTSSAAFASAENEYTNTTTIMSAPTVVNAAPSTTNYFTSTPTETYAPTTTITSNTGTVDPCTDNDPNNDFGCLVYDTQPYNPAGQTVTDSYSSGTTIYTQPAQVDTFSDTTTYYAPTQVTN